MISGLIIVANIRATLAVFPHRNAVSLEKLGQYRTEHAYEIKAFVNGK